MSEAEQMHGSAALSVRRTRHGKARVLVTFEISGRGAIVHFGPEYATEAEAFSSLEQHMAAIVAEMDRLGLKHSEPECSP